jgi:hypothetical protein
MASGYHAGVARSTGESRMATHSRQPVAHPYCRISHPDQRKGGGLERQTQADVATFAKHFGFAVSKRLLVDDGVSAWKGTNATPKHALGQFLADARRGIVPAGDCLLLENYDRLSRQDPWAAIGLVSELRQLGIHIGRLDRQKLLRCDSTDAGDFFEASLEFVRGNSESNAKSHRNGDAWERKRKAARENGKPITRRLPAWIREKDGKLELIAERADVVRHIAALATQGYGLYKIVARLTEENVKPFGKSKGWALSYVARILRDKHVIGEFQPCRRGRKPDGPPIKNYYPAVLTAEEFYAAQGAGGSRARRGRIGKRVELFSGLLKNARDGDSYYVGTRTANGRRYRVLLNRAGVEGRGKLVAFSADVFEQAIRACLEEIDPHEILNGDTGPDETLALSGELAEVEARIAAVEKELLAGDVATLVRVVRQLEIRQRELTEKLAEARQRAAHPLSESWGEVQSLLDVPDTEDNRLRIRAALKGIVNTIALLVVPRGRDRLCLAQIWFNDRMRNRAYVMFHQTTKANGAARTEGEWAVRSWLEVTGEHDPDLRRKKDVMQAEKILTSLDMKL